MGQNSNAYKIENIYLAALFAVGFGLVMGVTSTYGPAVGGDSVDYLSVAHNFAEGKGMVGHAGKVYIGWPPLYPLMLGALQGFFGLDAFRAGWVINGLAFGAIVALSGIVIRKSLPGRPVWFYLGTAATLLSWSILRAAASIGADAFFILFSLAFLLAAQKVLESKSGRDIVVLGAISALGAILRWNGAAFIAVGAVLLFYLNKDNLRKALLSSSVFGAASAVPLLLWVARGLLKYGSAFGRGVPYRDFFANLNGIYVRIAHWFLPESVTNRIPAIAFGVVVLAVLLLINRKEDWKRLGARLVARENLPMMLFLGLYLIILLITTTNSDHPEIFDDRYLAPVFVIIWILLFLVLDELALPHLRFGAGWKDYLAAAAILLWLLYPANVLRKYAVLSLESGMVTYNEYNNARYHQSEIMRMAQTYDFEEGVSISTNYPDGLYFFTGLDVLDAPREEGFTRFPSEELAPGAIERWQGGPEGYLIWFWPSSFKRYYLPEMLKQFMDVTTIYESRDGGFYYIAEREE